MPLDASRRQTLLYGFRREHFVFEVYERAPEGYLRLATTREFYSASDKGMAPVNGRFHRRMGRLLRWREVLEANGYRIQTRRFSDWDQYPETKRSQTVRWAMMQGGSSERGEIFYVLCPFHHERSPSLWLVPGGFHCFGCGTTGTMVDFVASLNKLRTSQEIKRYFADTFPHVYARPE